MSENLAQLNYSNRDYQGMKQELLAKIPAITSKWTDFNEADLGITLLELFVGMSDQMAFYLDRMANESYLPTARLRKSVHNICNVVDYHMYPGQGASVTAVLTLNESQPFDVVVPIGFKISTSDPKSKITYSVAEELVIPSGSLTGNALMVEGIRNEFNYVSDGSSEQIISLSSEVQQPPGQDTFVKVFINGVEWMEEYNTLYGTQQSYLIDTSSEISTTISFGDGTNGLIPPNGASILVVYWTGKGVDGKVGAHAITEIEDILIISGQTIEFTSNNDASSSGGSNKETIEHAKYYAPKSVKRGDRLVTIEDYDTYCNSYTKAGVGSIALSKAIWKSSDVYSCELDIRVLTTDISGNYALCTQDLKDSLYDDINVQNSLCQHTNILDGSLNDFEVDIDCELHKGYNSITVASEVTAAITTYVKSLAFGNTFYISELVSVVMNIDGVYNVIVNKPTADISVNNTTVNISNNIVVGIIQNNTL